MIVDEFGKSVTNLTGQIRSLQANVEHEDDEVLLSDADTFETALEQLYTHAERQDIDLDQYYPQLMRITDGLHFCKSALQWKMENVVLSERPLLRQSLGSVNSALHYATGITYLAQLKRGNRKQRY